MIAWLNPAALAGLALLAGPVLVHLLLRHRAERVPFPSLRFVRPSRTAAVRVRLPSDLALLLLRMAIVAVAIAAAAQPLLLVPSRLRAWNARMARVIVVDVSDTHERPASADVEAADAARGCRAGSGLRRRGSMRQSSGPASCRRSRRWPRRLRPGARSSSSPTSSAARCRARILDAVPPAIGIRLVQVGAATQERRVRGLELFTGAQLPAGSIRRAGSGARSCCLEARLPSASCRDRGRAKDSG